MSNVMLGKCNPLHIGQAQNRAKVLALSATISLKNERSKAGSLAAMSTSE